MKHDSFVRVTWHSQLCDLTHPYMWFDSSFSSSGNGGGYPQEFQGERIEIWLLHVMCENEPRLVDVYMQMYTCTYIWTLIYACVSTPTYVLYIYIHVYVYVQKHVYIYMYIHICIHMCI